MSYLSRLFNIVKYLLLIISNNYAYGGAWLPEPNHCELLITRLEFTDLNSDIPVITDGQTHKSHKIQKKQNYHEQYNAVSLEYGINQNLSIGSIYAQKTQINSSNPISYSTGIFSKIKLLSFKNYLFSLINRINNKRHLAEENSKMEYEISLSVGNSYETAGLQLFNNFELGYMYDEQVQEWIKKMEITQGIYLTEKILFLSQEFIQTKISSGKKENSIYLSLAYKNNPHLTIQAGYVFANHKTEDLFKMPNQLLISLWIKV